MAKKLNILIPVDRFWPEYAGWINHTVKMVSAIDSEHASFEVWTRKSESQDDRPVENFIIRRLPVGFGKFDAIRIVLYTLLVLFRLLKNRSRFDLVYLPHTRFPGFVLIRAARLLNLPVVARIAGGELLSVGTVAQKVRFKVLKYCSRIIVLNNQTHERLHDIGVSPDRIVQIPNGVDTEKFRPAEAGTPHSASGNITISFVGIICKRKGIHDLIAVINRLHPSWPRLRLRVAGPVEGVTEVEGEFTRQFEDQLAEAEEYIEYTGVIDDPENFLKSSDLFVLPSYAEGMPNVLLEAMSTGLPCISTDIPGVREVIENGRNGLLFSPGDTQHLEKLIEQVISDPDAASHLGIEGRKTILNRYSLNRMSDRYLSVFNETT